MVCAVCNHMFKRNWGVSAEDEFCVNKKLFSISFNKVWLSEPMHQVRREKIQAHAIGMKNTNTHDSFDIAAVFNDESSFDSSHHVEMS